MCFSKSHVFFENCSINPNKIAILDWVWNQMANVKCFSMSQVFFSRTAQFILDGFNYITLLYWRLEFRLEIRRIAYSILVDHKIFKHKLYEETVSLFWQWWFVDTEDTINGLHFPLFPSRFLANFVVCSFNRRYLHHLLTIFTWVGQLSWWSPFTYILNTIPYIILKTTYNLSLYIY